MSKTPLQVEVIEADSYHEWGRMLSDSPQSTVYSSPEYLESLTEATGGAFRLLGVRRGSELVGGIGLYDERTPFGRKTSGRFLLYYNSILLRSYETRYPSQRTSRNLETLRAIEQAITNERYARVRLHNHWTLNDVRVFLDRGWSATPSYTYVADLTDMDGLEHRIDRNFQRLINRCRETDLVATEDDDFGSLYRLHTATHERKGSPIYLEEQPFTRYFHRLRAAGLCRLDHLRTPNGRSVASQLTLLGSFPTAHTVVAGADPEFMRMGTTPYLRWLVFGELARLGYEGNDLTDAALNPVTRFKSQLGAELKVSFNLSKRDRLPLAFAAAGRKVLDRAASLLRARTAGQSS